VGFEVETFASASAFLTSGRLQDCSCLILDVQMPDQSGLALHKHLISLRLDVPVVFVTAFPSERARLQALKAGAVCYLPKPVDEEVLISCVRQAVGLRKM
jgi:FixJ family two-component response regulator